MARCDVRMKWAAHRGTRLQLLHVAGGFFSKAAWRRGLILTCSGTHNVGPPKVMVSSFSSPSRVLRVHYLLYLGARVCCSLPVCLRHTENAALGPVHLCILLAGWRAVYPPTSCCGSGWRKAIEAALQAWVFSPSGVPVRVEAGRLHLAATVGLEDGLWTFLFVLSPGW